MKFSIKKVTASIGATGVLVLTSTKSALAQTTTGGSKTIGNLGTVNPITPASGDLLTTVGNIVDVLLWVIGLLAVIYLIYGGVVYITAGGDAEKAAKGRIAITNAIIGIIIIVLALLIYNYVIGIA